MNKLFTRINIILHYPTNSLLTFESNVSRYNGGPIEGLIQTLSWGLRYCDKYYKAKKSVSHIILTHVLCTI